MKVVDLETFVVAPPPPAFGGRYWVFVKLTTDNGIVGYGEVYAVPFNPKVVELMIRDVFERDLEGRDPFQVEALWRRIYSTCFTQRPDVSLMGIASGLDMACWDIMGKALDRPVYDLLGGRVHDRLRSYTYLYPGETDKDDFYHDVDASAERAAEYVKQGFTALKFDPAGPYTTFDPSMISLEAMERSATFCKRIREAVGSKADLLFGTHGQMSPASAIRLAKYLEPYDPLWFEEPVPPGNADAMARVARSTSIPVATGERLTTKYEFSELLRKEAASILQFNSGRVGGITEARKIATMAEAHYAQIAPHCYCGPIEAAANIQVDTASPNFLIQESIKQFDDFHAQILKKPLQWEEGYLIPPTEPGIGVELDEDVARAHPFEGEGMHLEMLDKPLWH
ncbi:mandelate racemase/muconate lactonizing enzyme family protein [Kiloniella sp. b19]|uniref:mandelate racemase/muconate lactonizing enzyme family protein n=1 Tax=Kiloniella sp. GXU_MW_B19 TaxID=3141326 RepID=UPI0031D7ED3C